jgi:hypothetical protein
MPVPTRNEVMTSRSASYWLKNALHDAQGRDLLDALRDAEILAAILRREFDAAVASDERAAGPNLGGGRIRY